MTIIATRLDMLGAGFERKTVMRRCSEQFQMAQAEQARETRTTGICTTKCEVTLHIVGYGFTVVTNKEEVESTINHALIFT